MKKSILDTYTEVKCARPGMHHPKRSKVASMELGDARELLDKLRKIFGWNV